MSQILSDVAQTRPLPPLASVLFAMAGLVLTWENRRLMRCALKRLDAHLLHDIGLDPSQARCEAAKPFWRG
jgi:uncharacterized protein YjiS (DUF1127 family)